MALATSTKLAIAPVGNQSYRIWLTHDPDSDTVSVRERSANGNTYTEVGTLTTSNWETGLTITDKVAGATYYVIGYGSDDTILREISITLPNIDLSEASTALDDSPTSLYTGSIKETVRFDPKYRSEDWKTIYGNE